MIKVTRRRKGDRESEELEFTTFKEAKGAAFGFRNARIRCDSCEAVVINRMFCHETGCPEAWRDGTVKCRSCGEQFQPTHSGQDRCEDCHESLLEDCMQPALEQELDDSYKQ